MPPYPRLILPIILLGAILTAAAMLTAAWLGAPFWYGLAALPLAGLACWQAALWQELRLRRALMEAAPYRTAIYDRDHRLIWRDSQAGHVLPEALPTLPSRPRLEDVLKTALWHLPPHEREAEITRRMVLHECADGEAADLQDAAGNWTRQRKRRLRGGQVASFAIDITQMKRSEMPQRIEHDALTGLANRASFRAGLEAMAANPRGGLLLLIDLDHFKSANDRYGHAVGDALLAEAARRLREAVRPSDLVSRLGADEFAILAFGALPGAAGELAGRVRQALSPRLVIEGAELPVSACIGIACAPGHGREGDVLLRAADLALHEAKAQGRNTVAVFEPELRQRSEQRAELREAFAEALEAGELELHLQPQQDSEHQEMVGAEALIRWNSSRLGRWIGPAELIPAAGEAGLMPALDRFVLREAVAMIARWGDRPDAPRVLGINISVTTLHEPAFAEEVAEALALAGVAPHRLEIEIPEDLAIRDLPGVARTLAALRLVGVPLALDDFGGGHSGLPHVVRLPVQRLKLDRSIVAGLPDDPKSYAVLRATVALARSMGIEVIGEGVETQAQAFALRRAGVNIIQGYLVGKPVPVEELVPSRPGYAAPPLRASA